MIGVDEVGRGCLAGPLLVVAARQIGKLTGGLADSKMLTRQQRESMLKLLTSNVQFGEGWLRPVEIDRLGLTRAMKLGVKRALKQINARYSEEIIMDGPFNYFSKRYKNVWCLIDADATVPLVSAASIYAKVRMDNYMVELAKRHSKYGFESNVGYGTPGHLEALDTHGYLKGVHRRLFSRVRAIDQLELWELQV